MSILSSILKKYPLKDTVKPTLKYTDDVPFHLLSDSQKVAFKAMAKYVRGALKDEEGRPYDMFSLQGEAGSGKTWVVSMFLHWFLQKSEARKKIAICAPMWEAVGVCQDASPFAHLNCIDFMTVSSLIGQIGQYQDGDLVFNIDPEKSKVATYSVIFLDEAGMTQKDQFNFIKGFAPDVKVILIGDPEQLPPVGEEKSIAYDPEQQTLRDAMLGTTFSIYSAELKEQHRAQLGSPNLEYALNVRNGIKNVLTKSIWDKKGFVGLLDTLKKDGDKLDQFLKEIYTHPEYTEKGKLFRLLCYTTKSTSSGYQYWTNKIRNLLYGTPDKEAPPLVVGEWIKLEKSLMADSKDSKTVLLPNNLQAKITQLGSTQVSIGIEGDNYDGITEFPCYDATLRFFNPTLERDIEFDVKILHPLFEPYYKEYMSFLATKARYFSEAGNKRVSSPLWEQWHRLNTDTFVFFRHDYVRSVHSSQGSTFHFTMTDMDDIKKALTLNRDANMYRRIRYVATSRNQVGNLIL